MILNFEERYLLLNMRVKNVNETLERLSGLTPWDDAEREFLENLKAKISSDEFDFDEEFQYKDIIVTGE